jgi:hypothetical protein
MDISHLNSFDQKAIKARVAAIVDADERRRVEREIESAVAAWAEHDPDGRNDDLADQLDRAIDAIIASARRPE